MRRIIPGATWLILAALVLAVWSLVAHNPTTATAAGDEEYRRLRLFSEVLHEIQQKYVEDKSADELITSAIKGMVADLDPHSSYLTPDEFKDLQVETKGQFSGVGIEITIKDDILTVVSPIEGTPGYQAGLQAGDRIMKIDGKLTKGMSLMDAVKNIRGPRGTNVVLTILREGVSKLQDYTVVRDIIPLKSVRYNLLEDGYGYIRLSTFQENTTDDMLQALSVLQGQPVPIKGLILDLRNNPGGLLTQAVSVADLFVKDGIIVSTKGRIPSQDMTFSATGKTAANDYPIIALVNQGSASASEILAGALQDHRRALIMGTQTFGKGSVQTILPLEDRGALRLTTARYYTPSGRTIQAKGIEPDLVVPFEPPRAKDDEAADQKDQSIREKDLQGAIPAEKPAGEEAPALDTPESDNGDNKLAFPADRLAKDNQLIRALDLLKAWQVFSSTPMAAKQQ